MRSVARSSSTALTQQHGGPLLSVLQGSMIQGSHRVTDTYYAMIMRYLLCKHETPTARGATHAKVTGPTVFMMKERDAYGMQYKESGGGRERREGGTRPKIHHVQQARPTCDICSRTLNSWSYVINIALCSETVSLTGLDLFALCGQNRNPPRVIALSVG